MQLITGNKFKLMSDFIYDEKGLKKNEIVFNREEIIYFVKTDLIHNFFKYYKPSTKFILITHNSDLPITDHLIPYIEDENLIAWFGQNICVNHNKLFSIPIGIANEIWPHGNENDMFDIILQKTEKNKLIHCSFDISTNFIERSKCVESMNKNNLKMDNREEFKHYLNSLSKSFFSLSPNGNGIDCHKLWECLYLKTIPVVTKSINVEFYKDLPIFIIDSWSDFNINDLSEDLYKKIINSHSYDKIDINFYKNKILKEWKK